VGLDGCGCGWVAKVSGSDYINGTTLLYIYPISLNIPAIPTIQPPIHCHCHPATATPPFKKLDSQLAAYQNDRTATATNLLPLPPCHCHPLTHCHPQKQPLPLPRTSCRGQGVELHQRGLPHVRLKTAIFWAF
jgi:hypothetical protein